MTTTARPTKRRLISRLTKRPGAHGRRQAAMRKTRPYFDSVDRTQEGIKQANLTEFSSRLPPMVTCQAIAASGATRTVDTVSDAGGLSACTAAPDDCSLRGAICGAAECGSAAKFRWPSFTGESVAEISFATYTGHIMCCQHKEK